MYFMKNSCLLIPLRELFSFDPTVQHYIPSPPEVPSCRPRASHQTSVPGGRSTGKTEQVELLARLLCLMGEEGGGAFAMKK